MTKRDNAVHALDQLGANDPDNATTVGRYLEHLESLNHRLAQHAAAAAKALEAGKRDLMAEGWDRALSFLWKEAGAIDAGDYGDARIANPYREETSNE